MKDSLQIKIDGHVKITDMKSGELVFDHHNEIHPQNMALVIARALSKEANGSILKICFGNGGTFFNSSNQIVYRPPNTVGNADLYNQTYEVIVDDQSSGVSVSNSVVSSPSPAPAITSIITVVAQLLANEPAGQATSDGLNTNPESLYTFDEMGLKSEDNLLLSHLVFSPFEKAGNRAFLLTYTLTISVS